MRLQFESISPSDGVLQLFDSRLRELGDFGALKANQMVVVAHTVRKLVASETIPEPPLARDSAFGEELERSIDRGVPNTGLFRAHLSEKLLDAHVTVGLQKRLDDQRALVGRSQPLARHIG
jgi:hypothetical protein